MPGGDEAKSPNLPLPLHALLQDLAVIKANDIDLSAILHEANVDNSASRTALDESESSLDKSSEFITKSRSVLKSQSSGELENLMTRIERLRAVMENTLEKLRVEEGEDV